MIFSRFKRLWSSDPMRDDTPKKPVQEFVMMIPPECHVRSTIDQFMKINSFTKYEELEERAGCRRFRFT